MTGDTRILPGSVSNNPFFGGVGLVHYPVFHFVLGGPYQPNSIEKSAIGYPAGGGNLPSTFHGRVGGGGYLIDLGKSFDVGQESRFRRKLNHPDARRNRAVFTDESEGTLIRNWAYENGGGDLTMIGVYGKNPFQHHGILLPKVADSTKLLDSHPHGDRIYLHRGILILSTLGPIANIRDASLYGTDILDELKKVRNQRMNSMVFTCKVFGTISVSTRLTIGRPQVASNDDSDLSFGYLATYSRADAIDPTPEPNSTDMGDIKDDYTIRTEVILNLVQLGTHTAGEIWKIPSVHPDPGDG
jgi:hypothetical protein